MTQDYKDTLNLPFTDFPMKAGLAEKEPKYLSRWTDMDLYGEIRIKRQGAEKFILHDGPPYANGDIHLGHAVNKTLKDIVVKSKTLSGFDAPYIPGWDCHGLPIELNVEKKLGKPGDKLTAREFRQACRDYASSQIEGQKTGFKRLGVLGDWDNPYTTMAFSSEAAIIRSLAQIYRKGHLIQGVKPVYWCPQCSSALAEAEVEYADKTSPSIDVAFAVQDIQDTLQRFHLQNTNIKHVDVVIWTTTPWTLPANHAVAVNAELEYVLLQVNADKALIVAKGLLDTLLTRWSLQEETKVLASIPGVALEHLLLQHPFYAQRQVPVVLGDHVTLEAGTGCVHTAGGHGMDDYVVSLRYGLSVAHSVDRFGKFTSDVPDVGGLFIFKANEPLMDILKQHDRLVYQTSLQHSYPHCWRHKTPVIFRATPQWFVSMTEKHLREHCLSAIKKVTWIPDWGQARITAMLDNSPDWCVSRQRAWCVPIPVFMHKTTQTPHPQTAEFMEKVAQLVMEQGIDAWHDLDPRALLGENADEYEKGSDGLDVWFDAGMTQQFVLTQRSELAWPADLYLEGSDQHRGWFQSSLKAAVALTDHAPYKQVLTHGFTVDEHGRKMSKSLGNVIAPQQVIGQLGADVLRLWVAATDYRGELSFSDEILKRTSEAYRRIRNTARFLLANLNDFDIEQNALPIEEWVELDQWLLQRTVALQKDIIKAYDEYQFHVVYQKIHHFCGIELGSFYLDIIKDRQYTAGKNSQARRSAQSVMYHVLEALVRWLAPILSFTAEEICDYLPKTTKRPASVFLSEWYQDFPALTTLSLDWESIIAVRDVVNKALENARNQKQIGSGLEAEVVLYGDSVWQTKLNALKDDLKFVLLTSKATVSTEGQRPAHSIGTELPGLWLEVIPSTDAKCARCWHREADVGQHVDHVELCGRCVNNVTGTGEKRHYA